MNKKQNKANKKRLVEQKIFIPSVVITLLVSIPLAIYPDASMDILNHLFNEIVTLFQWGYIWYAVILVVVGFYFAFSKYGNVVLGDPQAKPRFNLFEYASILIAMGLGSTIMRTALVQWAEVTNSPPTGVEPQSMEAFLWGNSYSMFIWSFQTFAVFVVAAPALAYVLHVRKRPFMRISEACRTIFGDKFTDGVGGVVLDIIFMISILSGAAVTLGLGTPIVTYNIAELFGIDQSFMLTFIVTIVWVLMFTISAYRGLDKGIKILSTFNMYLAGAFAIFVLLIGPGVFILNYFTQSLGFLFSNYVDTFLYTNSIGGDGDTHIEGHKVFWFAYNATWAMLHSVFAAKVSYGRTIKEMIMTYFMAPMLLAWGATGILGGLGIERQLTGQINALDTVTEDPMAVVPEILTSLPLAPVVLVAFIILAIIFLTTTLDSTTYSIASYTGKEDMSDSEPSKKLRILIAFVITFFALTLLAIGGLEPLEVVSGLMGIPVIIVQFLTIYAAFKMMNEDKAWIYNIREEDKSRSKRD
ncbi:MAG TPA: BCCT family transporter [Pseudogracilibacillus sp.]|nr:BCCT family transporter [Pseudogracilibacillus sp.]